LLPRDVMLSLSAVQEALPELGSETATGENLSAIGSPAATRSVTFATADGTQHLVLSVDKYERAADASAAFEQASEMSKEVPGATGEAVSDLGEAAFIGIVTQGNETHVGGGALFGDLIVAATLQSYEGTDANKAIVTEIIRRQAAQARQALQRDATPTAGG
jgi:hypothetical protein